MRYWCLARPKTHVGVDDGYGVKSSKTHCASVYYKKKNKGE